jgi:hypothetical protein
METVVVPDREQWLELQADIARRESPDYIRRRREHS